MRALFVVWILIVIALHQDVWLWTNKSLVFGFLPIGLAYHGAYSVLASLTMALLVRFLWPAHLEEADDEPVPTHTAAPAAEAR